MHHEAIQFFRKILKIHEQNPASTIVPRARVYEELAEAYLADGRIKPAKEVHAIDTREVSLHGAVLRTQVG